MVGANNFIMAPYCWIARFTLGNVLPVARDLPISHIYGIKIPVATSPRYTLQMFTDKGLINYYFCMLLLHMKMCKLFKGY